MIGLFVQLAIMAIGLAIRLTVLLVVWTVRLLVWTARLLAMLIASILAFVGSRRSSGPTGLSSRTPAAARPGRPLERVPPRWLCLLGMRVPE